jgi:hypothetical protein
MSILADIGGGKLMSWPTTAFVAASIIPVPHARGHQLGEHVDRLSRAAKRRIPAHDLAYQPILGRRSGRAD